LKKDVENKISGEGDCERKELEGSRFIWVGKFAGLWGKCGVNRKRAIIGFRFVISGRSAVTVGQRSTSKQYDSVGYPLVMGSLLNPSS
jgi:hypothetical protein